MACSRGKKKKQACQGKQHRDCERSEVDSNDLYDITSNQEDEKRIVQPSYTVGAQRQYCSTKTQSFAYCT